MTDNNLGGWLLVTLAIVGLAVAVPVVGAHGDEPAADETQTHDGGNWAAWMDGHMGAGAFGAMGSHVGMTGDDVPHGPADGNYTAGQGPGC